MSNDIYPDSPLLKQLLGKYPDLFDSILKKKDALNVQIIYTSIKRDEKERPLFTDHYYNVDASRYFYPASTVKLPVVLLAMQRVHELEKNKLDIYTPMITGAEGEGQTPVTQDSSSADGKPSIAQYIRKILLVSDNDAFNRLYEFLGQQYINNQLHKMGYNDAQIIHRLALSLTEEQNRHTNPVLFINADGDTVYSQPSQKSKLVYASRDTKLGTAYREGEKLVMQPFDFSKKNRLALPDLHAILRSTLFPQTMPEEKRFNLSTGDYEFLRKYLSTYPRESGFPSYDSTGYPDNYVKSFLFTNDNSGLRIFSKSGTAYGFLTDVAYITDTVRHIEFFLSATIYCNSDGIFNDDKYDYETVGYPFLRNLARALYEEQLAMSNRQ